MEDSPWFVDVPGEPRKVLGQGYIRREWRYDDTKREVTVVEGGEQPTRYVLDAFGRTKEIHLPGGDKIANAFTNFGRTLTQTRPAATPNGVIARTTRFTQFGEPETVTGANGFQILGIDYDTLGRPSKVHRPEGTRKITYSSFGEVSSVQRVTTAGAVDGYLDLLYDRNGFPFSLADGRSKAIHFTWDGLDRLQGVKFADNSSSSRSYVSGTAALEKTVDRNGGTIDFLYDDYGKLRSVTADNVGSSAGASGSSELKFDQDLFGIRSAHNDNVDLGFVRNSLGLLYQEQSSLAPDAPVSYTRNQRGLVENATIDKVNIYRGYDLLGRVDKIYVNDRSIIDYDYTGVELLPSKLMYENGLVKSWQFDDDGRPIEMDAATAASQSVYRAEFLWRKDGHLGRIDRSIHGGAIASSVFASDELSRLRAENHKLAGLPMLASGQLTAADLAPFLQQGTSWTSYLLDAADNWKRVTKTAGVRNPTIGEDNRYESFDGTVVSDANGSTTNRVMGYHTGTTALGNSSRHSLRPKPGPLAMILWDASRPLQGLMTTFRFSIPKDRCFENSMHRELRSMCRGRSGRRLLCYAERAVNICTMGGEIVSRQLLTQAACSTSSMIIPPTGSHIF